MDLMWIKNTDFEKEEKRNLTGCIYQIMIVIQ